MEKEKADHHVLFSTNKRIHRFPLEGSKLKLNKSWLDPGSADLKNLRVYTYPFARDNLEGQAECPADFMENTEAVNILKLKLFPRAMVKLLQAVQHVITEPDVHSAPLSDELEKKSSSKGSKKDKKSSRHRGDDDDDGGRKGKKSKKKSKKDKKKAAKPNKAETFMDGNVCMNRVEQFIEDLVDDTTGYIWGWCVWVVIIDHPRIDISKGLVRLFKANQERMKTLAVLRRIKDKNPSAEALMICSAKEWVLKVMQNFQLQDNAKEALGEDSVKIYELDAKAMHLSIANLENPAHINHWFNFQKSREFIAEIMPAVSARYLDIDNYITEEARHITFPGVGVRMLSLSDRRPAVFHQALWIEGPRAREKVNGLTTLHRVNYISEIQGKCVADNLLYSNNALDIIEYTKKLNEEDLARTLANARLKHLDETREVQKMRKSTVYINRLNALYAMHSVLPPGHAKCIQWIEQQKMNSLSKGEKWSAMRLNHGKIDPNMSVFAHKISRDAMIFENVFGFGTLHEEMVLVGLWRLCAFDSRKNPLLPHLMLFGPAASGKSNLQKKLMRMSVDGTYRSLGHDTKMAYTSGDIYDTLLFIYDEMPREMIKPGEGKQGDPMFKTILSDNRMTTTMLVIDPETKERKAVEYTCYLACPFLVNTNVTEAELPEPITSRFFTTETVRYIRPGVDFLLKNAEIQANPREAKYIGVAYEEYKWIQAACSCFELNSKTAYTPELNVVSVLLRWNLIKAELTSSGILLEPRKDDHIISFTRTATLTEAFTRLFMTREVFETGKKDFEFKDFLEVGPYLFATEEHLIYAITASEHCITDVNADFVLAALLDLCKQADGSYAYKDGDTNGTKDYNFFALAITGVEINIEGVISKATRMVYDYIVRKTKRQVLDLTIKKILNRMLGASIECVGRTTAYGPPPAVTVPESGDVNMDGTDDAQPGTNAEVRGADGRLITPVATTPPNGVIIGNAATSTHSHAAAEPPSDQKESRPVMHPLFNSTSKCTLIISSAYLIGAKERKEGFLLSAIKKTFSKHTPNRRLLLGKTFRDADKMVPFVFRTLDAVNNTNHATTVMNLLYRTPGFEHCFRSRDEEVRAWDVQPIETEAEKAEAADQASSRYTVLDENMDSYYHKRFLAENYYTFSSPTFPVCRTWVKEGASYPEKTIKAYEASQKKVFNGIPTMATTVTRSTTNATTIPSTYAPPEETQSPPSSPPEDMGTIRQREVVDLVARVQNLGIESKRQRSRSPQPQDDSGEEAPFNMTDDEG